MPMVIDTESRVDTLVRAINDVLIEHGPAGLSLRRIAKFSGVSTSSMLHHLGSREHLLRVAVGQTARQRLQHFRLESRYDGVCALLPRNGEELLDTRAWLGWLELWRSEDFLSRWVSENRDAELALLAALTVRPMRLDTAEAVLRSLS